ncbi:sensor histidine kinase [Arcobacter sp. YIC-464]|uniref:sensor histidine kinase n=1 Tax=Arcobacter sp. YIC-464 TaxID=3376631 RepID=UPI003C2AA795
MLQTNEKTILNLIKYAPTLIVVVLLTIVSYLYFLEKDAQSKKDIAKLKERFIEKSKEDIRNQVDLVYEYINYEKLNSTKNLKNSLKKEVQQAHRIMTHIYEKYKDTKTKEEIVQKIKDALRNHTFNDGRGYFYIYDLEARNILHPLKPELEGKDLLDFQDKKGNYISKDILKGLSTNDEFFYELYWNKPKYLDIQFKKITYNFKFKPYGWFIGTGEYLDDFEKTLKKKILDYIQKINQTNENYVFVIDYKGNYLSHINKNYIGLNRIDLKDSNSFYITKEIIKSAKEGDGYLTYNSTVKPKTGKTYKKTTYVKGFDYWQWAIATGFYMDELESNLKTIEKEAMLRKKDDFYNILIFGILLSVIFILISIFLSRQLKYKFLKHKKELIKQINRNNEKDLILSQQAKMAAMGEMIGNIAHQWRQPLNAITTQSSGLKFKNEFTTLDKKEIDESMDNITHTVEYLSNTIDDFKDFFNPKKQYVKFTIEELLSKVDKLLGVHYRNRGITIIKNIDEIEVLGYENELLQVLINIFNNAKDEFERNKVEKRYIFIEAKEFDDKVIIKIKDNALGIPEDIINNIFKAHFTTKQKSNGTGIGLYMSKQILKRFANGDIEASNVSFDYKNVSYKGACFKLTIQKNFSL